jgi:hypothetical protein
LRFRREQWPDSGPEQSLVCCRQCGFQWFGPTAAHGLSVLGSCSRCGGELRFRAGEPLDADAGEPDAHHAELQPWQVLGAPTSWAVR